MSIEIELRYEVLKPEELVSFVAPFALLDNKHDRDIYFDNKESALYQRGIFIRSRNDKKLEFKFNRACLSNPHLAIQDYCEEHSFSLPLLDADLQKINELLLSLGLHQICVADLSELQRVNNFTVHYVVDKRRISCSTALHPWNR